MKTDRISPSPRIPDLDLTQLSFWAGYRTWLYLHRRWLLVVGVTLLLVFLGLLVASSAPRDPFTYDLY